jgi:hypothetical protein
MEPKGHSDPVTAPVAAAKLFTACRASFPHRPLAARE